MSAVVNLGLNLKARDASGQRRHNEPGFRRDATVRELIAHLVQEMRLATNDPEGRSLMPSDPISSDPEKGLLKASAGTPADPVSEEVDFCPADPIGGTANPIEEAIQYLKKDGITVNHLHFTDLYPLPQERVLNILVSCREIIAVEANLSSQMVRLIRAETGFDIKRTVNRYDGEPFTGEDIYRRVKKELFPDQAEKELARVRA